MPLTRFVSLVSLLLLPLLAGATDQTPDYQAAKWDPIHFQPAIDTATNEQCLACHEEMLTRKPRQQTETKARKRAKKTPGLATDARGLWEMLETRI